MATDLILPDLILLQDFEGNWSDFYDFVYKCFREEFVLNPLRTFDGKRLGLKKYPITDDKEATFYHMTHEGADEQNRSPDIRRMERIRWPKFMMSNFSHYKFKVWKNKRGRDMNILIFCEEESYLFVLSDRGDYLLPWTAYTVDHRNRRERLMKEYYAYKKAEAAK